MAGSNHRRCIDQGISSISAQHIFAQRILAHLSCSMLLVRPRICSRDWVRASLPGCSLSASSSRFLIFSCRKSIMGNIIQFLPQAKASTPTKHFFPIFTISQLRVCCDLVRKFVSANHTKTLVVRWFFLIVCVPLSCAISSFSALDYDPFAQLLQKLPPAMSSVGEYLDVGCLIARHISEELVTWGTNKAQVSAAEPVHSPQSSLCECLKCSAWSLSPYSTSIPQSQTSGSRISPSLHLCFSEIHPDALTKENSQWKSDYANVYMVSSPEHKEFPQIRIATTVVLHSIKIFINCSEAMDRY